MRASGCGSAHVIGAAQQLRRDGGRVFMASPYSKLRGMRGAKITGQSRSILVPVLILTGDQVPVEDNDEPVPR
jgi:hypothetical protein